MSVADWMNLAALVVVNTIGYIAVGRRVTRVEHAITNKPDRAEVQAELHPIRGAISGLSVRVSATEAKL